MPTKLASCPKKKASKPAPKPIPLIDYEARSKMVKHRPALSGKYALADVLASLPDDEVFSTIEIIGKLSAAATAFGGRVRDWIHQYPGYYLTTPKGMVIGSQEAIAAFCKFHSIQNPWQKSQTQT